MNLYASTTSLTSLSNQQFTLENVKEVTQLYFRDLSEEESEYLKELQVKFQTANALKGAKRALFGYLKMEQAYLLEKKKNSELQKSNNELLAELKTLKKAVENHFLLEDRVLQSKDSLLSIAKI